MAISLAADKDALVQAMVSGDGTIKVTLISSPPEPKPALTVEGLQLLAQAGKQASTALQEMSQVLDGPGWYSTYTGPPRSLPPADYCSPQLVADLRGTAHVIRRDGWVQGTWISPVGVCLEGGAMRAITGLFMPTIEMIDVNWPLSKRMHGLRDALTCWLGMPPASWNDRHARSGLEVCDEVESLAFEIERRALDPTACECAECRLRRTRPRMGALYPSMVPPPAIVGPFVP